MIVPKFDANIQATLILSPNELQIKKLELYNSIIESTKDEILKARLIVERTTLKEHLLRMAEAKIAAQS